MIINLTKRELENTHGGGGLVIHIDGYGGNLEECPAETCQLFIEHYDGKLLVHVWNSTRDPVNFELVPLKCKFLENNGNCAEGMKCRGYQVCNEFEQIERRDNE